jgi:hypothetical protein
LHPGAGAEPHTHRPALHVARPAGSFPQHRVESLPKQSGAVPAHPAASSDVASVAALSDGASGAASPKLQMGQATAGHTQ